LAQREGIGDLLAEGTAVAAKRLAMGPKPLAIHVKGLEFPMMSRDSAKLSG